MDQRLIRRRRRDWSRMIVPRSSLDLTRRRIVSTMLRSWVGHDTTVVPVRLMHGRAGGMIPTEVAGSRLPVGSSASRIEVAGSRRPGRWRRAAARHRTAPRGSSSPSWPEPTNSRMAGTWVLTTCLGRPITSEGERHVLVHGLVGQQPEVLEDASDVAPQERHLPVGEFLGDVLAGHEDAPHLGLFLLVQHGGSSWTCRSPRARRGTRTRSFAMSQVASFRATTSPL